MGQRRLRNRTFQTEEATLVPRGLDAAWSETVDSFLLSRHDLKAWTRRSYEKSLRRLSCTTLEDFTGTLVNQHIARKLDAGTRFVAHHDGVAAKQMAKWLVEARILAANPLDGVKVPKQPTKARAPFKDDEVRLILKVARESAQSERDEAILAVALACGLRLDELRRLQWPADLDLKEQVLWVREAKSDAGIRAVVIDPRVCALVDRYVKDWRPSQLPGSLFLNRHGDAFSYDGFSQIFRRIRKRLPASVDFKIHRARNTAIVNWWRAGVHPWDAQQMAGHRTSEQTRKYANYTRTPSELRRSPAATAFSAIYGRAV